MASTSVTAYATSVFRTVDGFVDNSGEQLPVQPGCVGTPLVVFMGNQSHQQARAAAEARALKITRARAADRARATSRDLKLSLQNKLRNHAEHVEGPGRSAFMREGIEAIDELCGAVEAALAHPAPGAPREHALAVALQFGMRRSPLAMPAATHGMVLGVYAKVPVTPTPEELADIEAWRATARGVPGARPRHVDGQVPVEATTVPVARAPTAREFRELMCRVPTGQVLVDMGGTTVLAELVVDTADTVDTMDTVVQRHSLGGPGAADVAERIAVDQATFEETDLGRTLYAGGEGGGEGGGVALGDLIRRVQGAMGGVSAETVIPGTLHWLFG